MMIELYLFAALVDGVLTFFRYTSASADVIHDGNTWAADTIQRGTIETDGARLDVELSILTRHNHPIAMRYSQAQKDSGVSVLVYRLTGGVLSQIYSGEIVSVSWSGAQASILCSQPGARRLDDAPRVRYQALCRHALYGRGCGLDKASFKVSGTVDSVAAGGVLVVADGLTEEDADWYEGGAFEAKGETRSIVTSTSGAVVLDRPIAGLAALDSFDAYAGCDRRVQTCDVKFNNRANFGGIPALPKMNPHTRPITRGTDV